MPASCKMTVYLGFSGKRLKHLENVAMFAAHYMSIDGYMSALTVVQVDGLSDNLQGLCLANNTILLQRQSKEKQTRAFFHELAHYAQFCESRLTDDFFITRERVLYINPYDGEFQPHETEADELEQEMMYDWRIRQC